MSRDDNLDPTNGYTQKIPILGRTRSPSHQLLIRGYTKFSQLFCTFIPLLESLLEGQRPRKGRESAYVLNKRSTGWYEWNPSLSKSKSDFESDSNTALRYPVAFKAKFNPFQIATNLACKLPRELPSMIADPYEPEKPEIYSPKWFRKIPPKSALLKLPRELPSTLILIKSWERGCHWLSKLRVS